MKTARNIFIAFSTLLLSISIGRAQTLYAITQSVTGGSNMNYLATIDPLTASVTIVSTTPLSKFVMSGLSTLDPIHKRMYYAGPLDSLYMVNLATGNMTARKKLSSSGSYIISLIEFNRSDSLLYGIATPPVISAGAFLVKINPFTGSVSVVSSSLSVQYTGGVSTLDPVHGRFYYTAFSSGNIDTVYTVNLNTATLLSRKSVTIAGTFISEMIEFNDTDTALYALRQSTIPVNYTARLNSFTGTGTINMASAVAGYISQGISTIDPVNNRFFYVKGSSDSLVVVNVLTGAIVAKNKIQMPANYKIMHMEFEKPYQFATGIRYYEKQSPTISLHPNPASGKVTVSSDKNMLSASLLVHDAAGRKVREFSDLNGNSFSFGLANLPAGIYFISLLEDHKTIAKQKLIVKE